MKLSIIIPVYNVEAYIGTTIESCMNQDCPEECFEVICVNDGSTDNSEAIIAAYAHEHRNIHLVTQPNSGVSKARNNGLDCACGEYVWFVDGDDCIAPGCIKHIIQLLDKHPVDDFWFRINHFKEKPAFAELRNEFLVCEEFEDILEFMEYAGGSGACSNIYNRSFLIENQIRFAQSIRYSEDVLFVYLAMIKAQKVARTSDVFYYYREREGSAIRSINNKINLFIDSMFNLVKEYNMIYSEESDSARKKLSLRKRNYAVKALLFALLKKGDISYAKEQLEQLKKMGFYPYPFLWGTLKNNHGFLEWRTNYVSFLFPCKWYFLICVSTMGLVRRIKNG